MSGEELGVIKPVGCTLRRTRGVGSQRSGRLWAATGRVSLGARTETNGVARAAAIAIPAQRPWLRRSDSRSRRVLFGALGTAPLAMALVGPRASPAGVLVVFAVLAGIGAVSASLVGAPVTSRPVGRVELRLRVVVVVTANTALVTLASIVMDVRPGSSRLPGAVFTSLWLTVVLALVALDTSRPRLPGSRPNGTLYDNPNSPPQLTSLPPLCRLVKRVVDMVVTLVTIPFALPVVGVAALAVMADSKGGWLHVQTRLGAQGRPFRLLKLRTMRQGSDDGAHRACMSALIASSSVPAGLYGKVAGDPRRTRVGKVLRRLSVDELPQLWNVIKGDMSLVGPRPPLPWEAELYSDYMWGRLCGKPGLTGLWQVEGRAKLSFSEMIELDLRYWEYWSPLQELKILARTPKAVLWSRNTE